jgi:fumarate reductase subunit D
MNRQRLANPFMWSVVGAGAVVCLYSGRALLSKP